MWQNILKKSRRTTSTTREKTQYINSNSSTQSNAKKKPQCTHAGQSSSRPWLLLPKAYRTRIRAASGIIQLLVPLDLLRASYALWFPRCQKRTTPPLRTRSENESKLVCWREEGPTKPIPARRRLVSAASPHLNDASSYNSKCGTYYCSSSGVRWFSTAWSSFLSMCTYLVCYSGGKYPCMYQARETKSASLET